MSNTRKMCSFRLPESTITQIKELTGALNLDSQADVISEAVRVLHVERVKFKRWQGTPTTPCATTSPLG
jgi:Arc/MetJ-type ribon-helix-helix transcriptional regulator